MVFARSRSEQIAKQSNQLVGSVLRNRVVGLDLEIAPLTRTARAISSLPERMCCFGSWLAGRLDIGTRERELLERPLENDRVRERLHRLRRTTRPLERLLGRVIEIRGTPVDRLDQPG